MEFPLLGIVLGGGVFGAVPNWNHEVRSRTIIWKNSMWGLVHIGGNYWNVIGTNLDQMLVLRVAIWDS